MIYKNCFSPSTFDSFFNFKIYYSFLIWWTKFYQVNEHNATLLMSSAFFAFFLSLAWCNNFIPLYPFLFLFWVSLLVLLVVINFYRVNYYHSLISYCCFLSWILLHTSLLLIVRTIILSFCLILNPCFIVSHLLYTFNLLYLHFCINPYSYCWQQ